MGFADSVQIRAQCEGGVRWNHGFEGGVNEHGFGGLARASYGRDYRQAEQGDTHQKSLRRKRATASASTTIPKTAEVQIGMAGSTGSRWIVSRVILPIS